MKISIIIVNWNVREEIKKCLLSLARFASACSHEVIVIDNASKDGSVGMIRDTFPQVRLIENTENRGFAAACNQGIKQATGEYCFFLNPDTEVKEGTIDALVRQVERAQDIAISAPRILNGDGTIQRSIRRFPTPTSQLLIFFKVRHFFPNISPLKRYFADDFDYDVEQDVQQPMGAALMIRRSVLDTLSPFDERFFIWFEEVDLCKRVVDAGYKIKYVPSAIIFHQSGKSFARQTIAHKQRVNFKSCYLYLEKHFGWRSLYATIPMRAYVRALSHPVFTCFFVGLLFFEILSYGAYFHSWMQPLGFFLACILVFMLSQVKLEYGTAIVLSELIIGSKGHLFAILPGDFSVRGGLFLALLLAWIVRLAARRKTPALLRSSFLPAYLTIGLTFAYALATGLIHKTPLSTMLPDANGWLYFLFIFPLYDALKNTSALRVIVSASIAALSMQVLKTLTVFYVMGHKGFGVETMYSVYRWIRTTGVGEVTHMGSEFYRIFFQSHIYSVIAFFVLLSWLFFTFKANSLKTIFTGKPMMIGAASGLLAVLLFSFSRSFWFAFGLAGLTWLLVIGRRSFAQLWRTAAILFTSGLVTLLLIVGIAFSPYPPGDQGIGFDAVAKRFQDFDSEAAAVSRWALFPVLIDTVRANPLGYGFGKTVTYLSHDPRIAQGSQAGVYTTYAFEWGYLDFAVKAGVLGAMLMVASLVLILMEGWKVVSSLAMSINVSEKSLVTGLWFGLLALMIIHAFTPYLVHPLGIALVLVTARIFEGFTERGRLAFTAE